MMMIKIPRVTIEQLPPWAQPAVRYMVGHALRTRLVLGLLALLLILLVTGVYALKSSTRMASMVKSILDHDHQSVVATQQIRLAATLVNNAVVMKLAGNDKQAKEIYAWSIQEFAKSRALQRENINSDEEMRLTEKLEKEIDVFVRDSKPFFSLPASQKKIPRNLVEPLSTEGLAIADTSYELMQMNLNRIGERREELQWQVTLTSRLLFAGMVTAVFVFILASYKIGKGMLRPIESLTESIRQVGDGNLDQEVPVVSSDELGQLARSFNKMAAQLRLYRDSTTEKLVRLHQTLQTTLDAFPDPVILISEENRIVFHNPASLSLISKESRGVDRLPEALRKLIQEQMPSGENYLPDNFGRTLKLPDENGVDHYYLPRLLRLDDKGANFGMAIVLEDVTGLRLANDLKSDLVSTVSHELKTPLTGLRTVVHMLAEERIGPLTEVQREMVGSAKQDTERLLSTLNNLLDLARIEGAPLRINPSPCRPEELMEMAVAETNFLAAQKGVDLSWEKDPELPPVRVDRQYIRHVFTNFVTNAIKHAPSGSAIRLWAEVVDGGGFVRFCVSDQGPGVPLEHQQHLFDKFYRVPGQKKSGSGLGLAIVREVAVAHGGRVGLESVPGRGATFHVDLPVSPSGSPVS